MRYPITDVVSIYKQARTGNKESFGTSPVYQYVNACIDPMQADIMPSEGGVASYQLFQVFIWDTTISLNNGDKIVAQDGTEYMVTGSPNVFTNPYAQGIQTTAKVII